MAGVRAVDGPSWLVFPLSTSPLVPSLAATNAFIIADLSAMDNASHVLQIPCGLSTRLGIVRSAALHARSGTPGAAHIATGTAARIDKHTLKHSLVGSVAPVQEMGPGLFHIGEQQWASIGVTGGSDWSRRVYTSTMKPKRPGMQCFVGRKVFHTHAVLVPVCSSYMGFHGNSHDTSHSGVAALFPCCLTCFPIHAI